MKTLRAWLKRLGGLVHDGSRDRELADELESHLAFHIADNMRAGMTPEEARRDARLKLGGIESVKEAYRDRRTVPILEHLLLDIRFTLRQLRKSPGFAATAILVLALGLGASIAIFAFVDAALIKPLPYPEPSKLVAVTESVAGMPRANFSYADYQDWKKLNNIFTSLDVFAGNGFLLKAQSGLEPTRSGRVSAGFFRTLEVNPALGRDFLPSEEVAGGPRVVMLSHEAWQHRFGARKDIVGQPVILSGDTYTVIGVLPPGFHFAALGTVEFWTLIDPANQCEKRRSCHDLKGIARLKNGVSVSTALAETTLIARRLEEQYPDSNRGQGASVVSMAEADFGSLRPVLLVLMGGAVLLLVIACVNVAGLVLVRSEGRKREMAVRSALGASVGRQLTQFVTEALVLVGVAAALGLSFSNWAMQALKKLIPVDMRDGMPFLVDLGLSSHALIFASAVTLLALLLFSVTPAIHLRTSRMSDGLAEGSRGSAGRAWQRLGSRLVIVELATAMVLLVGAGLFGQSLYRLLHIELGFQPDQLATLFVAAPDVNYKDEQTIALGQDVVRQLRTVPGVESAAITTLLPVSGNGNSDWIRFVGKPYDGKHIEVNDRDVSADYFRTIGAKLIRGRVFADTDDMTGPKVVIINESLARRYFPNEDPIGQQIGGITLSKDSLKTIVGVVGDIKEGTLDTEDWPAEYHPFNQDPNNYFAAIIRTSQSPGSVLPAMVTAIRKAHSDVGTLDEATMDARINDSMTAYLHRSSAWLVGSFALTALLLGVVGLYGVISHSVSQRTREIGVRMALGAERVAVYRMVMKEAGGLAALGIAAGTVASVSAAVLARSLLFGVSSWDVPTLAAVAAVLALAALAASFFPARRAARVNPMDALRSE